MTEKMNALRNKKGFTLIEMLVVIAIIAVLVAIVVPVVGNSTVKASAATNAANLRTVAAQISVAIVNGDLEVAVPEDGETSTTLTVADIEAEDIKVPDYKSMGNVAPTAGEDDDVEFTCEVTNGNVECSFGGYGVNYFAYVAENGNADDYTGEDVPSA